MIEEVCVCFSTDDQYIDHTAVALKSMTLSKKNNYYFKIIVISNQISEKNKKKLLKMIEKSDKIEFIDISDEKLDIFRKIKSIPHISIATYNRLLLPLLLPKTNKIIYLDSDLLVLDDLYQLWEIELNDNQYFGAVEDAEYVRDRARLDYDTPYFYYNAGVLVFNLKALRENNYYEKMEKQILSRYQKYQTVDQDVINDTFHKNMKSIPVRWNLYHCFKKYNYTPSNLEAYEEAKKAPGIVHFVGPNKVWEIGRNPYNSYEWLYIEVLLQTPWKKNLINLLRKKF